MSKKEKNTTEFVEETLIIPDSEVYTYQIEGLGKPHINETPKNYTLKKIIFIAVIIVSVSLSMFFSIRILYSETFNFTAIENGNYEFKKFTNNNYITELTIDYVSDIEYDRNSNSDPYSNFTITKDKTKPVTSVKQFAFNGDGVLQVIHIGENVEYIDGKAFYSCWALKAIEVDENNPNYCDVDGVLYSKDKSTVICYPTDHDRYLREKYGYEEELYLDNPDKELLDKYINDVMTYVIPSTVTTVGELCFNYSNLYRVYLPEGLKTIETFGFYEMPNVHEYITYKTEAAVEETDYKAVANLDTYLSLPDGLEYIGSDAFTESKNLSYMFIPKTVTFIGHHAFWDTVYQKGGERHGLAVINVELDEETFEEQVRTGDAWVPLFDKNLLRKIPVEYGCERAE